MKVVLFCGGLGLRMRDYSETLPKPMVPLGSRPILWHLMRYYAHYGHTDFILCLGHKSQVIKDFFLRYDECVSNDFVLSQGAKRIELLRRDLDDWRITFVDTGAVNNIGQRLLAVRPYLEDEDMFLANYSDGLTDCHLPLITELPQRGGAIAAFMAARPNTSFHFVKQDPQGRVLRIDNVMDADLWVNAGYFAFRREIFDFIVPGEELVENPFQRLIDAGRLATHRHDGFWRGCDTFKDLQTLEAALTPGPAPWEVWRRRGGTETRGDLKPPAVAVNG